jgi:hypothetical protein
MVVRTSINAINWTAGEIRGRIGTVMTNKTQHEVVVGNVGTVYSGADIMKARREYLIYVDISVNVEGSRAYGESVTRFADGEIVQEHVGKYDVE